MITDNLYKLKINGVNNIPRSLCAAGHKLQGTVVRTSTIDRKYTWKDFQMSRTFPWPSVINPIISGQRHKPKLNLMKPKDIQSCFYCCNIDCSDGSSVRAWMKSVDPVPQRPVRCSKPIFRPRLTTYPRKARVCVCLYVSLSCMCVWVDEMNGCIVRPEPQERNGTERCHLFPRFNYFQSSSSH